jgi:hypothetical protein
VPVVIYHDTHGIPHIYGRTDAALAFGAGYAQAQDRLFLMDVLRHYWAGKLTSFLGEIRRRSAEPAVAEPACVPAGGVVPGAPSAVIRRAAGQAFSRSAPIAVSFWMPHGYFWRPSGGQ